MFVASYYFRPWPLSFDRTRTQSIPHDVVPMPEGEATRAIEEAILANHPHWKDGALLEILAYQEKEWVSEGPTIEIEFMRNGVRSPRFELTAVPAPDGIPTPPVIPDSFYESFEPSYPVNVTLLPESAFPGDHPKLLFVPLAFQGHDTGKAARLDEVEEGRYLTFLPNRDYEVLSGTKDDGPIAVRWVLADSPIFLPGSRLRGNPNTTAQAAVSLAPGESYVTVDVRDEYGRPFYFGAFLAPSDGRERHAGVSYDSLPRGRFIRPGHWDLWIKDRASFLQNPQAPLHRIIVHDLIWPSPMTPDGRWVIRIPPGSFTLKTFDTKNQ